MKKSYISSRNYIIMLAILILLIAVGSFCDLKISQGVFSITNPIAVGFASFGTFPGSIVFGIMGMLIIKGFAKKNKFLLLLGIVLFILFQGLGILFSYHMSDEYWFNVPSFVKLLICAALIIGAEIPFISIIKGADEKKITKYFFFLFIVAIFGWFFPSFIKDIWARPRYRFLVGVDSSGLVIGIKTGLENFRNWFNIDPSVRDSFVLLGIDKGEFTSFPSGHVANTACVLALAAIGYINPKYEDKANKILWILFIYCLLLGFTRIVMGAHFLSDVAFGLLIDVLFIFLMETIFRIRKN